MTPNGVIAYHRSTVWIGSMFVLLVVLLGLFLRMTGKMLGISWHIVTVTGVQRRDDSIMLILTLVLLVICAMLSGLAALVILNWRLRDVPLISLGPSGITDHRKPPRTIAWSDVTDARIEWGGRYAPTRLWLTLTDPATDPAAGDGGIREKTLVLGALRENPADLLAALKAYPAYRGR